MSDQGRPKTSALPTDLELKYGIPLFLGQLIDTLRAEQGAVTELAWEKKAPITVAELHIFKRCLDNAMAGAVAELGRQRDQLVAAEGTQTMNERLGYLAHEQRNLLNSAMLAFEVIKEGLAVYADRPMLCSAISNLLHTGVPRGSIGELGRVRSILRTGPLLRYGESTNDMTIPFLGRVTPIQIVMLRFAGWEFDGRRKPQLVRSNARLLHEMGIARRALCYMTKRDFGYDLAAWHAYLKRDGGYSHPYGRASVHSKVERAIAEPRRKRLEAQLTAEEQESGAAPTVPAPRPASERRKSIDGLQLGAYIKQSLEAQGIKTLGRLERTPDAVLLALPGLGRATLRSLRAQLAERGLTRIGPADKA